MAVAAVVVEEPTKRKEVANKTPSAEELQKATQGRRVGGCVWKANKQKFSASMKFRSKVLTWDEKEALRAKHKTVKEKEKELREETRQEKIAKRQKTERKRKIKEENEMKSAKVQRITNTAKLKKLSKKQLRMIKMM